MKQVYIFSLIALIAFACKSNQTNTAAITEQKQNTVENTIKDKRILFLEYTVYSLGEDSIGATKNREYIAKGTLKSTKTSKTSLTPENLASMQYKDEEDLLDLKNIANPLYLFG